MRLPGIPLWFGTLLLLVWDVAAKTEPYMKCGACMVIVNEINWAIDTADPKEKVQVGSFRIDPTGNQQTHEIQYARSELHLTEAFDTVCAKAREYVLYRDPNTSEKTWIRKMSRDGHKISMTNLMDSPDLTKRLRFLCDALLEDYDEEMIKIFRNPDEKDVEEKICVQMTNACSPAEQQRWLMVQATAMMAGMNERGMSFDGVPADPMQAPESGDVVEDIDTPTTSSTPGDDSNRDEL